jgi:hypothetical protein
MRHVPPLETAPVSSPTSGTKSPVERTRAKTTRKRFQDYVSRIDNEAFQGYRVYIEREDAPFVRKYFSDKEYGSAMAACEAAWAYRRSIDFLRPVGNVQERRNQQGRVGVCLVRYTRKGTNYPSTWSWLANWYSEQDGAHKRSFSVLKYGYVSAYRLAMKTRLAHSSSAGGTLDEVPEPPAELVEFLRVRGRVDALLL